MTTHLLPKTTLTALAAIGLLLPFGAPLPGSCVRTIGIGVAGAEPSPSCSGDLRECLRASADMHQTTFGGRYVPAEDVAKCMEAFNSCIHGGATRNGNAAPPEVVPAESTPSGDSRKGLPERFAITTGFLTYDCRVSGAAANCTWQMDKPFEGVDSWTGELTGRLTGMTLTGTTRSQRSGYAPGNPGCREDIDYSGPATYVFNGDGSVAMRDGPTRWNLTWSGSCSDTYSSTDPVEEVTGKWSSKS